MTTIRSERKILTFERKCHGKITRIEGNERGNLHKVAEPSNLLPEVSDAQKTASLDIGYMQHISVCVFGSVSVRFKGDE